MSTIHPRTRPRHVLENLESRLLLSAYTQSAIALSGTDGANPIGTPVLDADGNLFASTLTGGASNHGAVVEIAAGSNTITPIASFDGTTTGTGPHGGLIIDSNGNLFGTTEGTETPNTGTPGTIFEIAKGSNSITTLATFNPNAAVNPRGRLLMDGSGNLFGTTWAGGASNRGTVFELPHGSSTITILASFNGINGASPFGDLIFDAEGDVVGTTSQGGTNSDGTIFEVKTGSGAITTLASFDGTGGAEPVAGLVKDAMGNFYGATFQGGTSNKGTIFELPAGASVITALASFNLTNGANPLAGLTIDANNNLFGTTQFGPDSSASSNGTVFELPAGSSTIQQLTTFVGSNGPPEQPNAGVVIDSQGNIWGTTEYGGANLKGTIFKLAPGGGGGGGESGSLSESLAGTVPSSAVAGQKTRLTQTVTITDSGAGAVNGTIGATLYLNTSSTLDGNQVTLKSVSKSVKLKANGHIAIPFRLSSLPADLPNGTYFVVAGVTDPNGGVTTTASASTITIAAAHIDLSASALAVPSPKAGKKIPVGFTLLNNGNVAAAGPLPIAYESSADANPADAASIVTLTKKINVKPGKSIKIILPVTLPAGTYALVIVLDPANTLADSDPSNNTLVGSIVTVA